MFNKDTDLLTEAYNSVMNEGKMKQIVTAIEAGDEPEDIMKDMNLKPTPELKKYLHGLKDEYYEKGERKEEDAERCPVTGKIRKSDEEEDGEHEDAEVEETAEDDEDEEPYTKHYMNF